MQTQKLGFVLGLAAVIGIVAGLFFSIGKATPAEAGGLPNLSAVSCASTTQTIMTVGNGYSQQVAPTTTRRALARIQQPANATNTVFLSLNNDDTRNTFGKGIMLTPATSTSPIPYAEFGLNTDINYTGPIHAIAGAGSTTVIVTQCIF